jgi:hypothetical protein
VLIPRRAFCQGTLSDPRRAALDAFNAYATVKGVGQDVSAGGRDLTKAANTVERKIQN